jgi:phage protein D
MIPVYKIEANDKNITAKISQYLSSLRITDGKGYESDSFEMTLSDPDAQIQWPTTEVKLKVWLGFKGQELIYKGEFVTDEVEFAGPPDHWQIKARSANLNTELKAQKSRSWRGDNISLGAILTWIAQQNKLKPAISKVFYAIKIKHIDQTNESDMHFITRLAKHYDATAKIAGGALIFAEIGSAKTASGDDMPSFKLYRSETNDYRFTFAGKSDYTGVAALWHSHKEAVQKKFVYKPRKKHRRTFKSEKEREQTLRAEWLQRQIARAKTKAERDKLKAQQDVLNQQLIGETGNIKTLKRHFASEAEAKNAAEAEYKRLARDCDTAEISVQMGMPAFAAECRFELVGWRADVDTQWVSKEVVHELSKSSGLTTRLSLEKLQTT